MRGGWIKLLLVPLVTACGLVAGIEDVTVLDAEVGDEGGVLPKRDGGGPGSPDVTTPPGDAPDDTTVDGAPRTQCDPLKPFGAPVPIAELNSANDDTSPRLTSDELTVFFASNRPGHLGGGSIYTAERATKSAPFSAPTLVPVINANNGVVYHPAITGDGLKIFLQVQFGAPTDIFVATRASTALDFMTPTLLPDPPNLGPSFEFLPFTSADGSTLYFSSNRSNSFLLYQSIAVGGVFGSPTLLPAVGTGNAAVSDTAPVMSADQLSLYFASTRTSPGGTPYDLFVAHRTTATGNFAPATLVTELNDPNAGLSDFPSWLSADNCRLYLTSDRATAGGVSDVYVAARTP